MSQLDEVRKKIKELKNVESEHGYPKIPFGVFKNKMDELLEATKGLKEAKALNKIKTHAKKKDK